MYQVPTFEELGRLKKEKAPGDPCCSIRVSLSVPVDHDGRTRRARLDATRQTCALSCIAGLDDPKLSSTNDFVVRSAKIAPNHWQRKHLGTGFAIGAGTPLQVSTEGNFAPTVYRLLSCSARIDRRMSLIFM